MLKSKVNLKIVLAILWLIFTSSLTLWWMVFALELISEVSENHVRHKFMLFWEGATLLGMLLIGGALLIYFIFQEKRHAEKLQNLFAAFSHDMKTRLAGIKLQAESIKLDNQVSAMSPLVDRMITDTSRLQVQVENSLFVGHEKILSLYFEKINLKNVIQFLQDSWPQLTIKLHGNSEILVDQRAFEIVLTNIFHNSLSHGQASEISITVEAIDSGLVRIHFHDNGIGFKGDELRLGEKYFRHSSSSGSGLGLFTLKELMRMMNGRVFFHLDSKANGFYVSIELPGKVL